MKRWLVAAAAALSMVLAGAPARATEANMTDWSVGELKTILIDNGSRIVADGVGTDGLPYVTADSPSGLRYKVFGSICTGNGKAQRCRGAQFIAVFDLKSKTAATRIKDFSSAFAVIDVADPGTIRVVRYLIFDGGVARANVMVNLEVFLDVANQVWTGLG